ncbi:hypothetical protein CRUP_028946 [Coryphaenoides rupestris]|nr:hypothetical protein CRUP_028946 [Coryphaenoides rupestris]
MEEGKRRRRRGSRGKTKKRFLCRTSRQTVLQNLVKNRRRRTPGRSS